MIGLDNDGDPEFVLPRTRTPTCAATTTGGTPTKVASGVVTSPSLMRSARCPANHLGLLRVQRERLAPRKNPGLRECWLMRLLGLRKHELHMVPLFLLHRIILPRLMRLIMWIPL